ncbi:unnamed protein product, partial [Timema podura]|nr:unnamed protein product [Timema podura]
MYTYSTLEKITLRFLISGHSYLPNDADFGDIEFALKLQQRMYSPEDYINIMLGCCKINKLVVTMMDSGDFVGTTALEKSIVKLEKSREGFTNLTGVDYSKTAIDLAKAVADAQQNSTIKYEVCDILAEDSENVSTLLLSCY